MPATVGDSWKQLAREAATCGFPAAFGLLPAIGCEAGCVESSIRNRLARMPYTTGFDREKYIQMQSEHIQQRRAEVGGKLYLEMGGKLFDDNHASRVLPGFTPDNKIAMLDRIKDEVEIVILSLIHI